MRRSLLYAVLLAPLTACATLSNTARSYLTAPNGLQIDDDRVRSLLRDARADSALRAVSNRKSTLSPDDRLLRLLYQGSTARYAGHNRDKKKTRQSEIVKESEADFLHLAEWALESDVGRQYAKISGDYNPIHLSPWSAKLLGFKKPIAHGMLLVAKAQAELEQAMGTAVTQISANFLKPAMVPGQLRLEQTSDRFRIMSGVTLCATGTFSTEKILDPTKNER